MGNFHVSPADFAEPLVAPSLSDSGPSSASQAPSTDGQPPEESVAILSSMGFPRSQAVWALKATVSFL